MNQDNALLKKCLEEIEKKLQWIDSKQWQQRHFELLSEEILNSTKINLSPLTLKRLWGKTKYESNPSTGTLDALAKFLNYKHWIDYQQDNATINKTRSKLSLARYRKPVVIFLASIGLLLTAMYLIELIPQYSSKNYSNFEFSFQQLSSEIPNTVYFSYNAMNTDADSVLIQQTWDPRKRQRVDKNKTDFSCIYYYPGYYRAKFILDDSIVSDKELYIKSNGWLGIIPKKTVPYYLPFEKINHDGRLEIMEENLFQAGFDLKNDIPITTINLVEDFNGIKGNNFKVVSDFKQTYSKGEAICQKSALTISCTHGYFYIPFSIKGCVNELSLHLPGKGLKARDNDLSFLGIDGDKYIHLELDVSGGTVQIKVNENPVFTDSLLIDPGKIVGLEFSFHGTGIIKSFELISGDQQYHLLDFNP